MKYLKVSVLLVAIGALSSLMSMGRPGRVQKTMQNGVTSYSQSAQVRNHDGTQTVTITTVSHGQKFGDIHDTLYTITYDQLGRLLRGEQRVDDMNDKVRQATLTYLKDQYEAELKPEAKKRSRDWN